MATALNKTMLENYLDSGLDRKAFAARCGISTATLAYPDFRTFFG